ncbi:MAG: hypothetical protein AAF604_11845 [Acidobacteriota bacterium]
MRRLPTLLSLCFLIGLACFAGSAAASDADFALEHVALVDGGNRIEGSLRLTGCDAGEVGQATVAVEHEGRVLAEQTFDLAAIFSDTDGGDPCANTSNDKCDTQTCPDAIINGKKRKGTCEPSIVLCVCDYGVVGIDIHVPWENVPQRARLEVVVDPQNQVAEVSESNNRQILTR